MSAGVAAILWPLWWLAIGVAIGHVVTIRNLHRSRLPLPDDCRDRLPPCSLVRLPQRRRKRRLMWWMRPGRLL